MTFIVFYWNYIINNGHFYNKKSRLEIFQPAFIKANV
jgi:hypothetical protein